MPGRRVHLLITGLVQGVSYRASAKDQAAASGLCGWVRNLPSGDVEALVEGHESVVSNFIDWCRQGPPEAKVERVAVIEERPIGDLSTFKVLR